MTEKMAVSAAGLLLCCAMFLPARAGASEAITQLSDYQKQEWQVEDGLPQSQIRALAQAPGGPMLIATYGGLALFDGLHFTALPVDGHDSAASEAVNAALYSRNGDLWIGTDSRGIVRRFAGTDETVNVSEQAGLFQERLRGLFEDRAGTIWAATQNGIERITPQNRTQTVEELPELGLVSGDTTTPFAEDGQGGVFVLTENGIFHWQQGKVHPHALSGLHTGNAVGILRGSDGVLWIGLRDGLLRLIPKSATSPNYEPGQYREERTASIHSQVTALIADHAGTVWVGTRTQGLCHVSGGTADCWGMKQGLADNYVRSLYEDDEHDLWIGLFRGGLSRWRTSRLTPLGQPSGLPNVLAANMLEDRRGDLWIGTWGRGLYRLHQGRIEAEYLPGNSGQVRALAEDTSGHIWIGTWFNGLFHYEGNRFRHYLLGTESVSNAVSVLLTDRSGGLWVGTYTGLLHFADGVPANGKSALLLKDKLIICLAQTGDGSILVGTATGMYRIFGSNVQEIVGLSYPYVVSISVDGDNNIWVGTKAGGLDWVDGNQAHHVPAVDGMTPFQIFSVTDDGQGLLWLATTRGILRLPRAQLEELIHGKRKTLDSVLLGKADGMPSSECMGAALPSAVLRRDGSIWFVTAKGLVHTNRRSSWSESSEPVVKVTGITTDQMQQTSSIRIRLAPGAGDTYIQFDAKKLSNPTQLEFRYKLQNYDTDWTITRQRSAHYRHLPPGRYQFLVNVRNAGSPWPASDSGTASVSIDQRPYVYQTWWFYALLACVAAAIVIRIFRWRVARAKGQIGVLLEERNRIAREWHDTLMAGFAAISWQLEATSRLFHEQSGGKEESEAAKSFELARSMVNHCQAEARRIIWDLRGSDEPSGVLSQALARSLATMAIRERVETTLQVEGDEVPLAPACVHHLVCIGQEAVTNALRHADPREIAIRLHYQVDSLSLSVRDDGNGFQASETLSSVHGHFGIPVMEERARKLGGYLRLQTTLGSGTEVLVNIPFHPASATTREVT